MSYHKFNERFEALSEEEKLKVVSAFYAWWWKFINEVASMFQIMFLELVRVLKPILDAMDAESQRPL